MNKVNVKLSEQEWLSIRDLLPGKESDPGRTAKSNRGFVEAVLWVKKNNAKWSKLPPEVGNYKSIHKRYKRWQEKGVWQLIFKKLGQDIDTGLPVYSSFEPNLHAQPCKFDITVKCSESISKVFEGAH
ncbi:transposase [Pseudoalteromonas rubra]|uniref:transposase n=1 Tax=Pseudoalteromonas rubra TaxID=43658 RepID=UPI00069768E0|nr:transposase [Pseudoalteromonas rubra]